MRCDRKVSLHLHRSFHASLCVFFWFKCNKHAQAREKKEIKRHGSIQNNGIDSMRREWCGSHVRVQVCGFTLPNHCPMTCPWSRSLGLPKIDASCRQSQFFPIQIHHSKECCTRQYEQLLCPLSRSTL